MSKTKKIAYLGMLIAIIIILSRLLSFKFNLLPASTYSLKLDPGYIVLLLSGMIFGPIAGAVTGLAADILGFFVGKGVGEPGGFFPGFTVTYILIGFLGGIAPVKIKENVKLFIPYAMGIFIISSIMNTFWLYLGFGMPYHILIIPRTITAIIVSIPFAIITTYLYKISRKFLK